MSERTLALFLHRLLDGSLNPVGPARDAVMLHRLAARPAPVFQTLIGAHVQALLSEWPAGNTLRPTAAPTAALWVAAALNNLAWAAANPPDPRLLAATTRLVTALPAADTLDATLAYHALLRRIERIAPPPDWRPVAAALLARDPLTAAWLPRADAIDDWKPVRELLRYTSIRAALHDRLLRVLPHPEALERGEMDSAVAIANAEAGRVLGLWAHGGAEGRAFALALYEADCALNRRGDDERPVWPLLDGIRAARASDDALRRRNAERLLARYQPLTALFGEPALLRPYTRLDARFLDALGMVRG